MTEIAFHFNAADKLAHVCRLLRKSYRSGAHVAVRGDEALLHLLDRALWATAPSDFIPHCRADAPPAVLAATPIVLAMPGQAAAHHQVLVNLGDAVPDDFQRFERLIEVVARDDEQDRQHARRRWKHYADRGYALVRHDLLTKQG